MIFKGEERKTTIFAQFFSKMTCGVHKTGTGKGEWI